MLHVRIVPVLISGSMFIGLDLTSTDRAKRMKGVFLSGRYLFTDFYGSASSASSASRGGKESSYSAGPPEPVRFGQVNAGPTL